MTTPDYAAGEALALTQVQAVSGFGASNTSRANWRILNGGKANVYAILHYGGFSMEFLSSSMVQYTWITVIEVWQRYTTEEATVPALTANLALIIQRLLAYRKLGDSRDVINDSNPRRGGAPAEMWTRNGNGPAWLRAEIELEWREQTIVTFAE